MPIHEILGSTEAVAAIVGGVVAGTAAVLAAALTAWAQDHSARRVEERRQRAIIYGRLHGLLRHLPGTGWARAQAQIFASMARERTRRAEVWDRDKAAAQHREWTWEANRTLDELSDTMSDLYEVLGLIRAHFPDDSEVALAVERVERLGTVGFKANVPSDQDIDEWYASVRRRVHDDITGYFENPILDLLQLLARRLAFPAPEAFGEQDLLPLRGSGNQ